ncbi:uroporphyrinogen-III C-methyltransferase [Dyella sp. OK004]|uniref:uroporphyrinogen-III C-methyltransferase n=1 Tax=Dyella sp. OK004 TaxID=1855292 RepID=UPI000B85435B|nr:uroporphyrinogen-III C-methyltransferase [Dyella sp. OK004]
MSQDNATSDTAAKTATANNLPSRKASSAPQPHRGGGSLAFALLLSLVAVGGAGYVGWRQYVQETGVRDAVHATAGLDTRVANMEHTLETIDNERNLLRQRLGDADQVNRSLREELLGQAERTRNLEDAVAKLSEKTLSGHDGMLLDETESLLRMAKERYALFHDAQGAAAAYALADQTLAAVNDGAFSGLRQSLNAEREALSKSQPAAQSAALDALTQLRAATTELPLKPLDTPADAAATDTWSRVRRALTDVIRVQRVNSAPLAVADARFARELVALDLAQAQSALLAYDSAGYAAALKRADANLAAQFDTQAPTVQQVRSKLATLAAQLPSSAPVELGAALSELRNLRSVHALKPPAAAAEAAKPSSGAKP